MTIFGLAWRNIRGNAQRSATVFLCVMGVAMFFVSTAAVIVGTRTSIDRGIQRLGADLLIVPEEAQSRVETALLMGRPANSWMPGSVAARLKVIPGVARVSPQVYLASLYNASCCSVSEMFVVAIDPETDFTISPWLQQSGAGSLARGEAVAGSYVFTPPGENTIRLYGYDLTVKGNLEATGTGIDQALFITMETAQEMAQVSITMAEQHLDMPADSISAALVKVSPGWDPHSVALHILLDIPHIYPIKSPDLFGAFKQQMVGLLWGLMALVIESWVLNTALVGLIFSMAASERRREMGVLRVLGATWVYNLKMLLFEAGTLATAAAATGTALSVAVVFVLKDSIARSLGMPFLFPSLPTLASLFALVSGLSLITVGLAAALPALRVCRQEMAPAMRE